MKKNKDSKMQEQTKYLNFDELQKHYDSLNKDSIDEVNYKWNFDNNRKNCRKTYDKFAFQKHFGLA